VQQETSELDKAETKVVTKMTCTVYSAHIWGLRCDALEDSGCDNADDSKEWQDAVQQAAVMIQGYVPSQDAQFYSQGPNDFGAKVCDRLLQSK
jgi:hypothetical protein